MPHLPREKGEAHSVVVHTATCHLHHALRTRMSPWHWLVTQPSKRLGNTLRVCRGVVKGGCGRPEIGTAYSTAYKLRTGAYMQYARAPHVGSSGWSLCTIRAISPLGSWINRFCVRSR